MIGPVGAVDEGVVDEGPGGPGVMVSFFCVPHAADIPHLLFALFF